MRDHLLIYVNGQRHEIRGRRVFQSLSDFLRYDLRLTGTKVVCAEGDCGSCTVFLGVPGKDRLQYRTVTSCIQFLYQLDCTHIVTVEGLSGDGKLNAVQEAMVRGHGAQCGFCTPGFVVSLCDLFERTRDPDEQAIRSACVGNLCRCTGYDPIIRAALDVDPESVQKLDTLHPSRPMLDDLHAHARNEVLIRADDRVWFKPASITAAARFRQEHSEATIIAGGTDLGVLVNKGLRDPKVVISIAHLDEINAVTRENGTLVLGAAATLAEMERACAEALPEYARLLYWFGSPPIRSAATLGGNIANGSPIGDTMPALYVLNAEIELTGVNGSRRVNINDFYTGYKKTVANMDELITRIHLPLPAAGEIFKLYKVSRRRDLDISAFTAAFWMRLDGGAIAEARVAYGGVGPNILRLRRTEQFLLGRPLAYEAMLDAGPIARSEISPISDVRGSAEYRGQLSENILRKFYFDVSRSDDEGNGRYDGNGDGSPVSVATRRLGGTD